MENELLIQLEKHLKKAVCLIENKKKEQPSSMIDLILERYKKALELIKTKPVNHLTEEEFHIHGSVRAYLDVYSDYPNSVLEEMNKCEEIIEKLFE